MSNLLSIEELSTEQINEIFVLADDMKENKELYISNSPLKGKTLGMIFEKSSTRTRVSFEVGMFQLGGSAIFLSSSDIQLGRGESIRDTAQVLSRYLDGIMIRTSSHSKVLELAAFSSVPVINGLSDLHHPCQVLSDIFTLKEKKNEVVGLKIAYIGDGNNVANSLLQISSILGIDISIATPEKYECNPAVIKKALEAAEHSGSQIILSNNPTEAAANADAVYTDTWISMGMEGEKEQRIKIFNDFKITPELMSYAKPNAVFMHCMPAYRNCEVSADVIDGPQSIIIDQAENRLHVQKAIMALLLSNKGEMDFT